MMPAQSIPRLLFCAALLAAATLSHAEKADRSKPVNLEADRVTVDDVNKVHLFDGNVTLSQGTLSIRGDKLVVTQRFVKTGATRGDLVVVSEGLKAGEQVVTSGLLKLRNDAEVTINDSIQPAADARPTPENR